MKFPKNSDRFHWTSHIKRKMAFYRIAEQKIRMILKSPDRREEGIAPETIAAMKRNDTPRRKEEIWVMYRTGGLKEKEKKSVFKILRKTKYTMISAWRYPGVTKIGERPFIPEDIAAELGLD